MAGGGGGGTTAGGSKKARIEIIPLIDIMFFLLASFMLVSMSMTKLQTIKPDLPNAQSANAVNKPDFTAIGIDKGGNIYFDKDKDPIQITEVAARLVPIYNQKHDDMKVFINADSGALYSSVVAVLAEVQKVGLSKVSFPVKKDTHFDPNSSKHVVPVAAANP